MFICQYNKFLCRYSLWILNEKICTHIVFYDFRTSESLSRQWIEIWRHHVILESIVWKKSWLYSWPSTRILFESPGDMKYKKTSIEPLKSNPCLPHILCTFEIHLPSVFKGKFQVELPFLDKLVEKSLYLSSSLSLYWRFFNRWNI